jgi:hypothetical protein
MLWLLKGGYKSHLQIVRGPELGNGCNIHECWLTQMLYSISQNSKTTNFMKHEKAYINPTVLNGFHNKYFTHWFLDYACCHTFPFLER